MWADLTIPKEGDLYRHLTVGGHDFPLRYGYYDEQERNIYPPVVILPDLTDGSLRCPEGYPLVTQVQDPCPYYTTVQPPEDNWCGDCIHFTGEHREIGICKCIHRKLPTEGETT